MKTPKSNSLRFAVQSGALASLNFLKFGHHGGAIYSFRRSPQAISDCLQADGNEPLDVLLTKGGTGGLTSSIL